MLKKLFVPEISLPHDRWIEGHKYVTLSILLSSTAAILIVFMILRYMQDDMYMVKADAVGALMAGICAYLLRLDFDYYKVTSRLFVFMTFVLALVNMNLAQHGSRAIWLATIIVATFYFRDRKEGLLWTAFFVAITFISEYANISEVTALGTVDYISLVVNFMIISVLLSWYEKIKERDKERLLEQTKMLEEKVSERTCQLEALSITDELTGMYNRRYLYQIVERLLKTQRRDKQNFVFAMMDIDGFKEYNDTYGHFAGDEALKKVAGIIKKYLGRGDDYGFRVGGEEFCIITTGLSEKDAFDYVENIRKAVADLKIEHEQSPEGILTVSFGVEDIIPDGKTDIDTIYKNADKKLYQAKEQGRNRTVV